MGKIRFLVYQYCCVSMLCEYSEGAQLCFERVWSKKQPVEVIKIVTTLK